MNKGKRIQCPVILLLCFVLFCGLNLPIHAESLVAQLRNHQKGLAVCWVGNDGWLIQADGLLIATDLDLETGEKVQKPAITPTELVDLLDVAFVTHHHGDHFNEPTLVALAQGQRCTFVLPRTCLKRALELGIPEKRIVVPEPGIPFRIKGVLVEPLHAIHGNQDFTVLTREEDFIESIAHNCGYLFNLGGKRIFQPGDSILTEEHLELKNIDVLFVSPTVHNMYIDRSMILINRLQPAYIFPQHFSTYREEPDNLFWTRGYPDELKMRLSLELQRRYHKLTQGEIFRIEP
jgi:L-ascorbate 6-phosphate lactonase